MTFFDAIVIVVVLVSAVLAMVRGFVREVLSVASWVIAAVAAYYLHGSLLSVIHPSPVADKTVATIIAVAVIFLVILVIATYLTMKVADFVIDSRIGAIDRVMGFVFGGVRGLLLVVIAFVFFDWLVQEPPAWIAEAQTEPMLADLGDALIKVLPPDIEAALRDGMRGPDDDATPAVETPANGIPDAMFTPTPAP